MDSGQQLKGHISIQKGLNIPPPQKCNNCCYPSRFHCPFCLPTFFKPSKRSRARIHLSNHLKRAIYFGEYTIHRCGLGCRKQQHYHCLYCTATLLRKRDFTNHLPYCHQAEQRRAQKGSLIQKAVTQRRVQTKELIASSLTPGESDIPSYEIDSDNDSDDVTVVTDSDDQSSQGASSSSQSATPFIPKCDTAGKMKGSAEPDSSKCHQTVQTNFDKPQDCDEYYFMSLVKMFKKLSPQKKADVRMKIERLLFEAEFE
ncbi:uncharacterized protein LOC119890233 [Micropterus salmoides]|uniref:uncharacterized protein LOC119890233 n=1 Tax=Micropterus salmoides TaxID=27706 RepID=UPI0018EE15D9|nr:uncharacterized protein LOC119890233 [Micropterus salmoides]